MSVLSSLQLVETQQICLHEEHETSRLTHTSMTLVQDGVLRHPPLAMQMTDGRYLILDGAHRTAALQHLGSRYIPVQVVKQDELRLDAWEHIVAIGSWFHELKKHPELAWHTTPIDGQRPIAEVINSSGETYYLYLKGHESGEQPHLSDTLRVWHSIVGSYSKTYAVLRRPRGTVQKSAEGTVCLRYPVYAVEELEQLVAQGHVMPAGVTRFLVSGRLLNLGIPLSMLMEQEQVDQADHQGRWMELCRQWENKLRLYMEPVYLCEG
ncbi:ParB N-terminal domain-containing protein [Brevibacillus dissolubilis]|uniref:ParB N-terminal domain-containing protein n=1 Tax=Brevibacillus dissolubilis TaxID=1844116 RepID=UPI0011164BEC|nr:ParB N-terminal domain-containing protein [Brevibacillus dissolubilis]